MAEEKNPLSDRVKKMAAIMQAAKEAGKKAEEEKAKGGQAETVQPSPQAE